jgi:hypothetical protein
VARFVGLLLFLVFAQDWGDGYAKHLGEPLGWAHQILLAPTPINIRPFDIIMLGIVIMAATRRTRPNAALVPPMRGALLLVVATTLLWFAYGMRHGGEFRFASWQTYLILSTVLLAFAVASTFRTPAEFSGLGKWLVAAAMYKAFMCWLSYFTWAQRLVGNTGAYMTSHDDTVLWVVGILVLIVNAVSRRSLKITARNLAGILFLMGAIQWNSRRLAWVSLVMGLIVMYVLFPSGAAKRRINRVARYATPLVLVYVVVGWGRANPIFLPLRSISSVSTHEDSSTLARNAENLGLIATANGAGIFGTGWGVPYSFLTMKYDISGSFELWRYIPHNSILGILAFTDVFGFAGFWIALPTAIYLNSRVAKLAADPQARNVGIIAVAQMIVCTNQLYGDMGIFFPKSMYTIALSYAIALRLPRTTGVWGTPSAKPPA